MLHYKNNSALDFIAPCNPDCSFCFLNYAEVLGENFLFRGIKPEEIGTIVRKTHHQVRSYRKGEIIANSGDEFRKLCIIVEGAVVGEIADFEGKVLRVEELKAPDTVASAFIFGDNDTLPVTITAVADTRLLIIARQDLLSIFRQNEQVLLNYLTISANRAQHLSQKIRMLGLQSIREKLAHFLLEQVKKEKSSCIRLTHSQRSLAEIFGITRPSLARVLHDLNREGVIASRGKEIRILDNKKLSGYLS